ncbi:MAG: hypothetical protein RL610_1459, partial [Pseudomonadota bacterium]
MGPAFLTVVIMSSSHLPSTI